MERPKYVKDALTIDEVGLVTGHYGPFALRSCYQPIFDIDGDALHVCGMEGLIKITRDGITYPPTGFFQTVKARDKLFIECMCQALHLRNFHHLGSSKVKLFFNINPLVATNLEVSLREIRYHAKRAEELGVTCGNLVCEIVESKAIDTGILRGVVKEYRRHGIQVAIDDYGAEHSNMDRVEMLSPDIVKIDGGWFRQLAAVPAAARLTKTLIRGFQHRGIKVLIEGIETAGQLETATECGADLVQGFFLAAPRPVGEVFDFGSLSITALASEENNVIRLAR